MAKATVCRPEPVAPPPVTVTLELSESEARWLHAIVGRTSGSGVGGNIYGALNQAKMIGDSDYAYKLPSIKCFEAEEALTRKKKGGC